MKGKLALIAALALTAIVPLWGAAVTFDFDSSFLDLTPGTVATLSGTLTNIGSSTAFINGDSITSALPFDDTAFLVGAPASLMPGEMFHGPVFNVIAGPGTPVGLYPGVFDVLGGDTNSDAGVLASRDFAIRVVPEPGAWSGIAGAAFAFGVLRRRGKVRS